jgi:murein DD-endopeptidase MepM/ murein hydrolase activator NlpD
VRASGDGTVVFAGAVAGTLHVTLSHADGLRTSYSFLATVEVVVGQRLRQGDRLGTSGDRFHFGVRSGGGN